jgi:hypothetical protein
MSGEWTTPDVAPDAVPAARQPTEQDQAPPAPLPEQRTEPGPAATGLSDRDRAVLAFERQWWRHAGAKEQAIRDRFGISATRYYQVLNALLDRSEAVAYEPQTVNRLRRLRAARQRARRKEQP